jgi:CheY-like chemotaxis protein
MESSVAGRSPAPAAKKWDVLLEQWKCLGVACWRRDRGTVMAQALALVWAASEQNESGSSASAGIRRSENGHPAQSTILVVDDEVLLRLAGSDFLRECGYRVLEAVRAEEAQAIFRSGEPIELLFSDIDLGSGMNGIMLAAWVRQNYPAVRIVLTSGVASMAKEAADLCDAPLLPKLIPTRRSRITSKRLLAAFGRQGG